MGKGVAIISGIILLGIGVVVLFNAGYLDPGILDEEKNAQIEYTITNNTGMETTFYFDDGQGNLSTFNIGSGHSYSLTVDYTWKGIMPKTVNPQCRYGIDGEPVEKSLVSKVVSLKNGDIKSEIFDMIFIEISV